MKKLVLTILVLIFSLQCKIFKPSDLDPSQDLGSLQTLLRYLALADAFNTCSQTVAFMKFTDSNGTPYSTGTVEYSVFNEADENGIPTSPYGENIQPLTVTLDTSGRGFLFFSERGIANLTVKNSSNVIVGTAKFRIYNGITKQSFSILSQTGATQVILEDLANYRNRMASYGSLVPLGSANGRQFLYIQTQTSYISSTDNENRGYIISSIDGENYDQVIAIDGVSINTKGATQKLLKISQPTFDGNQYVFFLSEQTDLSGTYTSNKNLVLRIPTFSTPSSVTVETLALPTNYNLFTQNDNSWLYPALYVGNGRFVVTPYFSTNYRPTLISFDSITTNDLNAGFSCAIATPERHFAGYQVFNDNGNAYLQCPTSLTLTVNPLPTRTIRMSDLSINMINFDATGVNFESNVFSYKGKLIALANGTPPYNGYTFPTGSYSFSNPTISRNSSPISGISTSTTSTDSILRAIKGSLNSDYMILSNNALFSAPTLVIYKSTDAFSSATTVGSIPTYFSSPLYSLEQFQSANGKLNLTWNIYAGTGIDSRPVYLTHFTNDDGTWESLPRLIKIR
ncbi:hypothetical protein EHQ24_15250 [Leptospira noumeaensis]|uniref:Uncharacterized protein n=1 Tax=Leptospira noumeaensis TaxID=2484964 RepID=A0A4R9I0S1_9LEPT|nr:hypothetical protein [Leptospira noumeaensis]TGK78908.1 hypothetical protein EHQ24_15250 [Leptospira noumeaensis]